MRNLRLLCGLLFAPVLGAVLGCVTRGDAPPIDFRILDPFKLRNTIVGFGKPPVRVGVTHTMRVDPDAAAPSEDLQWAMQSALAHPVQFEVLQPFQIKAHLQSGRLQFAMIADEQQAEILDEPGVARVVAHPVFEPGANEKCGLLITAADSDITAIDQLKGRRIAFGRRGHPITHVAAMRFLEDHGVPMDSIPRQLVPLPGSLQHHISSPETAWSVVHESEKQFGALGVAAGFILKSDYDTWPETGGNYLLRQLAKSQVRVLGETPPIPDIPDGPVLVSDQTDAELAGRFEKFLLEDLPRNRQVCKTIGLVRYERADAAPTTTTSAQPAQAAEMQFETAPAR